MTRILTLILTVATIHSAIAQTSASANYLHWSPERKLTVDDFQIKKGQLENNLSFAQFSIDFKVNGFDFMTKNFNKKVSNAIIRPASWIDTTAEVQRSLLYQQTLFDLSEIYTRRFRQQLKLNRKKIASGTSFVNDLSAKIMTDFSKRRLEYDMQTSSARNESSQSEWEQVIKNELMELSDFAADK